MFMDIQHLEFSLNISLIPMLVLSPQGFHAVVYSIVRTNKIISNDLLPRLYYLQVRFIFPWVSVRESLFWGDKQGDDYITEEEAVAEQRRVACRYVA